MRCDEIGRDPMVGSDTLSMQTNVAPTGGREAIARLLMRERQREYTQLKSFRYDVFIVDSDITAQCLFYFVFLDPEGGSQNTTLVVVVVLLLGISSLKIPEAFLRRSAAQRNFAYTFVLVTVLDFSVNF